MFLINFSILITTLLILLDLVYSAKLNEDDQLSLILVEYGYNITKFYFEILNKDKAEINDHLSSRIAVMNDSNYDNEIFDIYSPYINKYWIFLVNSSSVADKLLQRNDYKNKELHINGIIIPESLNYKIPEDNNNPKIPVFIAKNNITKQLYNYDIRYMNKHTYFLFNIKRAISSYPETYFLIISILFIIAGFILIVYWKIKMKSLSRNNVLSLHKFLYSIPFFIFLLAIALLVKAIDIRGKDPNAEYEESVYVDTAMITLSGIFKTVLWFLILLISHGWKISIQTLQRDDVKFMMKMFLVIYIFMCLDQIIDSTGVKLWIFHLSEIKNIIFFIGMYYILFKKISRTLLFLQRKIYYARLLNLAYIEALSYKIKLILKLRIMLYSYLILYFIVFLIHKIAVYSYDTPLLENYDYTLVDFYLSLYLLTLFRPQLLPNNFNIDLGNDLNEDLGLIFKSYLPNYDELNKVFKENPKDIQSIKNNKIPILILGPCLNHYESGDQEEVSINNYINNIEIGFAE